MHRFYRDYWGDLYISASPSNPSNLRPGFVLPPGVTPIVPPPCTMPPSVQRPGFAPPSPGFTPPMPVVPSPGFAPPSPGFTPPMPVVVSPPPMLTAPEPAPQPVPTPMPTPQPLVVPAQPPFPDPNAYYWLSNQFLGEGMCLESNAPWSGDHGGNSFMLPCRPTFTGMHWKFIPLGNGYYRLTTRFLEDQNLALEGNHPGSQFRGGAAFMAPWTNATGQRWKLIPAGDGLWQLTNQFLEGQNLCLEGNERNSPVHGGSAFMAPCSRQTGQIWSLRPV